MFEFCFITIVLGLVGIEVGCVVSLAEIIKKRLKIKSERRRAASRRRIYNELYERWAIADNRKALWDSITK